MDHILIWHLDSVRAKEVVRVEHVVVSPRGRRREGRHLREAGWYLLSIRCRLVQLRAAHDGAIHYGEIEARPRILIIMQACKGLDVGAIEFVQNTIFAMKKAGVGVLYVSTELEHVLDLSDRIAVMCRGEITGIIAPEEATAERLGELMAGVRSAA